MHKKQRHRLTGILVREVSLVDHAANKRRYLIAKREEETMTTENELSLDETSEEEVHESEELSTDVLSTAVEALEALTQTVAYLGQMGVQEADARVEELATGLRETAERLLPQAEPNAGPRAEPKDTSAETFEEQLAATRDALARLNTLTEVKKAEPETAKKPAPTENKGEFAELKSLMEEVRGAFASLSEKMKEQQQRLGKVEKQFGIPNSWPDPEEVLKGAEEGWPMDLNDPIQQDTVDSSVSFYD